MINSEIFNRVATAIILAFLALAAIFSFRTPVFEIFILTISLLCTWEWTRISLLTGQVLRRISLLGGMFVTIIALTLAPYVLPYVLVIALIWWATLGFMLIRQRKDFIAPSWRPRTSYAWVLIVPGAAGLCCLYRLGEQGPWYVLTLLLIIWTTDTFAYAVGRLVGRRPLAASISPSKTVEGAIGGMVAAIFVGFVCLAGFPISGVGDSLFWFSLFALTSGFGIIGDLSESAFKRHAGVKDSGRMLPGHGGVLDRMDSVLAGCPIFVAGIFYIISQID